LPGLAQPATARNKIKTPGTTDMASEHLVIVSFFPRAFLSKSIALIFAQ